MAFALLSGRAAAQSPREPDQLTALVREALQHHPALAQVREDAAAAEEIPSQRGSLPDPMFTFSAQNIRFDDPGLTSSPMSGLQFGLQQTVPFPGKLGNREATAAAAARANRQQVELVAVQVALRVRRLYWQLHFAERALEISQKNEQVLTTLTDVVVARFGVGQGAQQDALQAEVAHSRIRTRLQELTQAVDSARRALNAAVGREPAAKLAPTQPPTLSLGDTAPRAHVASIVEDKNPALRVTRARLATAKLGLHEASYERWPDLMFAAGYRLRRPVPGDPSKGADMFVATVGVTLPLWMGDKQNAAVRQRQHELNAAQAALHDVRLDLADQTQRTLDAAERLRAELTLFERELLPEADQALDASISDYQVARVDFVSVLSNWKTLLEIQIDRERLQAELAQRDAELIALRGETIGKGKP